MKPYRIDKETLITLLKTNDIAGLSSKEATIRLQKYGPNSLPEEKKDTWLKIFINQFKSPLIYVLLCAAVIIFFFGDDPRDAFIISAVLLFNALIGTIQEGRTARIVETLKKYIETSSVVVRDGTKITVPDVQLVTGDLVLLQEGQRIPADMRIIESNGLQINQAVLTGESKPIRKTTDPLHTDEPVTSQHNMAFKGTYVLNGSGKGIVVAIGLNTEIGKIHTAIQEIQTDVPLRKDVERLAYMILLLVLGICIFLFTLGFILGKPISSLFVMLTALFICVVPEGLPIVLTLILVSGVYRMAKQYVLVKNMQAVETLGRTNVLVIDKTGTLTRNEMMVSRIFADDQEYLVSGRGYHREGYIHKNGHKLHLKEITENLMHCINASYLLNSSELFYNSTDDFFTVKGDPTEAALGVLAIKVFDTPAILIDSYKKEKEEPFNSQKRFHAATFSTLNNGSITYLLGAPETITAASQTHMSPAMNRALDQFLADGLRVVCCGYKMTTTPPNSTEDYLNGITIAGIIGIEDALREDITTVVNQARYAGLKLVMATGDHEKTALYVAKKTNIYTSGDTTLDGSIFDTLTDAQLANLVDSVTVYSRVSPLHKMRIIKAFHDRNRIVAMTGDGINDAPSLVAADLGIAMGRIGTEVAKQAADIILLDDALKSIITAIKQGRHIFYTLKRVVLYFFATNMGEILIILFALTYEIISGIQLPLPITASQILWLNLVTDGFLDIALSMEPEEAGLMERNWFSKPPKLIDAHLIGMMFFFAIPMGIGSLWIFLMTYTTDIAYARTMTLITMAMFQWFNAWNCRSNKQSLFSIGLLTNKWLLMATSFVFILQIGVVYAPFLQKIFKTVPLTLIDWIIIMSISLPIILIEEIRKHIVRRMEQN